MHIRNKWNNTMECNGGKIVSNDFCEKEFSQPIAELRARYAEAFDKPAYKQSPVVKARCQYRIREATSDKTLVGFGCDLSRFYCFQTPLAEKREVKFIGSQIEKEINPLQYYTLNEDMCAPGVIENIDYTKREGIVDPVEESVPFYTNSKDSINELADVHNTLQVSISCPCPGNLDVDSKLTYTVEELFVALEEDPNLEFVCSSGGVAGNSVTATNLSSSALCTGMTATAKRNVTKYLPAPYMRIEEDTDTAKCYVTVYRRIV
jgi:hypothetical protein